MWNKGESGNPAGRKPGSKNKATEEIRQAYIDLVHGNLENITLWLQQVAADDPAKAMDFMLRISPFVIPKLNQTDITSNGEPFKIVLPAPPKQEDTE
jgi:hypothetical protein